MIMHDDVIDHEITFTQADRLRLFTSIQALWVYIKHDGQMELTRDGHKMAVFAIETWMGVTLPRNGKGQRLRRERIALANALVLAKLLEVNVPDRYPTVEQVMSEIDGEFPLIESASE